MKILITAPLYPPDTSSSALYVKELAKRLSIDSEVTIITYSYLPEKIEGVKIVSIDKRQVLPFRILSFTISLFKNLKNNNILYTENGASVELPVSVVSLFYKKPIIVHIGDKEAYEEMKKNALLFFIHKFLSMRSSKIVSNTPQEKPEIIPFKESDGSETRKYDESWEKHLEELDGYFLNTTKNES